MSAVVDNPIVQAVAGTMSGVGGFVGPGVKKVKDYVAPPKSPTLMNPNALSQQPTQADGAKVGIEKTLAKEKQQASTSTILSGGQGLLDTPTTTSRTLLGN